MSEEQLKAAKAAETEAKAAAAQVEENVEEISEDDLEGVTGGMSLGGSGGRLMNGAGIPNLGHLFDQRE